MQYVLSYYLKILDPNDFCRRIERLGEDISDGLLGFISMLTYQISYIKFSLLLSSAIGIDTTADYAIGSNNYNNVTDASSQEVDI